MRLDRAFTSDDRREIVEQLERIRTIEYVNYLNPGELPTPDMTLEQIQDELRNLSDRTGQEAALIYVVARENEMELLLLPPKASSSRDGLVEPTPEEAFPDNTKGLQLKQEPKESDDVARVSYSRDVANAKNRRNGRLSRGTLVRYTIPDTSRETVVNALRDFRRTLTNPRFRFDDRYLESSQQLYEWIVAPLEPHLEELEIDTLLFSLGAGLRSMPLAALHDGDRFLVENYSLSLVPSFTLLDRSYQQISRERVLAMGASQFTDLPPLPAVPLELELVAGAINQDSGQVFLNERFTQENLHQQRQAGSYDAIHFATHAAFQSGTPSNSYIQFWDDSVQLNEFPNLHLHDPPVNLLVLSACQTAVGDRDAELGFSGLAVYSGARSVIASLWSVSDEGTLGLMGSLYHHLGTAPIKAEAIAQAQRDMIAGTVRLAEGELQMGDRSVPLTPELGRLGNVDLSHPYYWSGFTTVGSPW